MPINTIPVRQEVTSDVLMVLTNDCIALNFIGRQHQEYFEGKVPIGTTLQIKRPWKPVGREGQAFQPEAVVQPTVPLVISFWRGCDFVYNDTDEALYFNMDEFFENYSKPIGIMLSNRIDSDFLTYMQMTIPNFVGTPGTLPTTTSTYNSAQSQLNQLLAPGPERRIIYNSSFNQNLVGLGQTLFNPAREISNQYLDGIVGRYAEFDIGIDEQLPGFTVGTYAGTPVVNGSNQSGSTISIRGFNAGSTTLGPGDRITYAGLYKVNPNGARNTYSGTNGLFSQVVQQTVSDVAGVLTPVLYPPMLPSGDFQNCFYPGSASGAPPDGTAVTIQGASGSQCQTAFAIQKEAFTCAFIKLMEPSDVSASTMGGKAFGMPGVYLRMLRQFQSSGPYAGYQTERVDVQYGIAAQYADYMSTVIYG